MILRSPLDLWEAFKDRFSADLPEEVRTVNAFLAAMEPLHKPFYEAWYLNIANIAGQQYVAKDPATGKLRVPPAPSWRVRLVVNKIKTCARILLAKILPRAPIFYAVPQTRDDDDVKGARLATKVAENIYHSEDWEDLQEEIAMWLIACGICDVFVIYDPDAGRDLFIDDVNPITGKSMVRRISTGDLVFDVASPFEIVRDLSTPRKAECAAVCRKKLRSVQYVKDRYGKDVTPDKSSMETDYAFKVMNIVSQDDNIQIQDKVKNAVVVKDYYEMPSRRFREGRHLTVTEKETLFSGSLTGKLFGKTVWPLVTFTAIPLPGRLMPMDMIQSALPLQWKYNRARSQMVENTNQLSRPKIFAAEGEIPSGRFTDEPGELVQYVPGISGQGPYPMKMPELPGYFLDNLKLLQMELEDDMSVHDISLGRLPRRATSGAALSILEEKDTTMVGPVQRKFKRGLEKVFSMALAIAGQKFIESRIMKIVGKSGTLDEIISWKGTDLRSCDDIRILQDADLPSSRAAKMEFVTALVKEGILPKDAALKLMNLSSISQLEEETDTAADQRYAESENFEMLKGVQVLPSEFENFGVHMTIHLKLLKRDLPTVIRENVITHIKQTDQLRKMFMASQALPSPETPGGGEPPAGMPPLPPPPSIPSEAGGPLSPSPVEEMPMGG